MQQVQETKFNEYIEKTSNPANRNFSSGVSGVLGSSSQYVVPASLPDLMASKRERKWIQAASNFYSAQARAF